VVVHAHQNLDLAEQVASEIRALGRRSMAVLADVRVKAELEAAADRVKAELGPWTFSSTTPATRQDGPSSSWATRSGGVMNVNLRGTVYATKAFVRGMMTRKWGASSTS